MGGFVDYLPEVFAEFGAIALRKMFGGHGVYYQGLMFGLVADDTLFLKADAGNAAHFDREQLPPFTFTDRHGRTATLSYRRAPDGIFDDPGLAAHWAQIAFEAALRGQAAKKPAGMHKPRKEFSCTPSQRAPGKQPAGKARPGRSKKNVTPHNGRAS